MQIIISMLGAFEFLNPFNYIKEIFNLIPKLIYFISATAMSLLDIAQMLMRKLAGLDAYYNVDGDAQTGDITLSFLQGIFGSDPNYAALRNAFWSLMILAVILLVVATIISVIRQEYMPGQEESRERPSNTKVHVINRAFKSLFMFLIVPVSVFFGLMFSDAILRALDTITSGSGSSALTMAQGVVEDDGLGGTTVTYPTDRLVAEAVNDGQSTSYIYYDFFGLGAPTTGMSFSGFAFKTAGFSANRVRMGKEYKLEEVPTSFYKLVEADEVSNFSIFNMANSEEEMALMIDDAFAGNVKLRIPQYLNYESVANSDIKNSMVFPDIEIKNFSKFNVALVWYYYDLWQYNFVVAMAFLAVSLKILIKVIIGLMKRIIELVALFIVSPPIIALMPLDGGKAFGQWKNSFLSKALGSYGAIIGMNILFLLLPYINQIKFLNENIAFSLGNESVYYNAAKMVNMIISTLFIITGLIVVEGFISLLSTIIGAEDVAKEGGELTEKVGDTLQTAANRTALAAGIPVKIATAPFRLARDGANAIGRKVTGDNDFKIGGAIARGAGSAAKLLGSFGKAGLSQLKIPMTSERKAAIREQQEAAWKKVGGGADQAYDNYLESQSAFKNDINERFAKRTDSSLDYDKWLSSEEGQNARELSRLTAESSDVQGRSAFRKALKGPGKEALENYVQSMIDYQSSAFTKLSKAGGFIKKKTRGIYRAGTAVTKEALNVGENLSAYASHIQDTVIDALGRKGKPAFFKSMGLSFLGKSAKDLEKDKKISDFYKEQKRKEDYEKRKGTSIREGMSEAEIKNLVKKEAQERYQKENREIKEEMNRIQEENLKLLNKIQEENIKQNKGGKKPK